MSSPPDRIVAGRYRIKDSLGAGGMATVYRAYDTQLERTVAIKLFHDGLAEDPDDPRQRAEVTLLASLAHPGLVALFDAGRDAQGAYLVMEYVEGENLREHLTRGPLDSRDVARIGAGLASALAYTHARSVVHRDIKPANILLPVDAGRAGTSYAKLVDFGIARLIDSTRITATGTLIGTAGFLSPEQARGAEVGSPSDIYSLGLVLLEALTGQRAFPGTPAESALARLASDPQIPSELGPVWNSVLREATARDPHDRPSAEEASERLRDLADVPAPTLVMPASDQATEPLLPESTKTELLPRETEKTAPRSSRRNVAIVAAIAAGVAAIAIASAFGVPLLTPSEPPPTSYPAVEGQLGLHLQQLQERVEP